MPAAPPSTSIAAYVCAVIGEDAFLRAEAVQAHKQACCPPPADAFNAESFDLPETGVQPMLSAASCLPMLARKRFVVGHNVDKVAAKDLLPLLHYLQAPVQSTLLLLTGSKLDARLKLSQALKAGGCLQMCESPKARDLPRWILQRAQRLNISMHNDAATTLAERVGPDMGVLAQNLDKLSLYAGANNSIERAAVEALVQPTREASIFALTDAVAQKQWAQASCAVTQLLQHGEEPLVIVAMLARQVRLLLAAKSNPRAAAKELGVPPFVAENLLRDARRFAFAELLAGMRHVQLCDASLKSSSSLPAAAALQRLVFHLSAGAAHNA